MAKSVAKKGAHRKKQVKEFDEEVIQIDRVTRVVAGGRRFRFRVMVAIGNKRGKIGLGVGKAGEIVEAIQKALKEAKKNMVEVNIVNDTIPHDIKVKVKSSRILLMPAAEGTGIIAGGAVRKIVELSGIKNILGKSFGTTNKMSNAKATVEALSRLSLVGANMTLEKQVFPEKKKEEVEEKDDRRAKRGPRKGAPKKSSPKKNEEGGESKEKAETAKPAKKADDVAAEKKTPAKKEEKVEKSEE